MSTFDKMVMQLFNYYIEEADGNIPAGRKLFIDWVEETSPVISDECNRSWQSLVLGINWQFQEAMRPVASDKP
jgi:hypothetical protein